METLSHNEKSVYKHIEKQHLNGMTYREIGDSYKVSYGVISNILKGVFPKSDEIRSRLHLLPTVKIEVPVDKIDTCPVCNTRFYITRKDRDHCSKRCADKAYKERKRNASRNNVRCLR